MVCKTCKGLQESDPASSVEWVNTGLPSLRQSSTGGCRACTLLLQGILLHHDRFAGVKEESIHVVAQSFDPTSGKNAQDHLSVEVRWKEAGDGCCAAGEHKHDDGYPDLKLEFFTDQGMQLNHWTRIGSEWPSVPARALATYSALSRPTDVCRWPVVILCYRTRTPYFGESFTGRRPLRSAEYDQHLSFQPFQMQTYQADNFAETSGGCLAG